MILMKDPYIVVTYGGQRYQTRVCNDGGTNPVWNETLSFGMSNDQDMEFAVWDKDTMSRDDSIGFGRVFVQQLMSSGGMEVPVPLQSTQGRMARFGQMFGGGFGMGGYRQGNAGTLFVRVGGGMGGFGGQMGGFGGQMGGFGGQMGGFGGQMGGYGGQMGGFGGQMGGFGRPY